MRQKVLTESGHGRSSQHRPVPFSHAIHDLLRVKHRLQRFQSFQLRLEVVWTTFVEMNYLGDMFGQLVNGPFSGPKRMNVGARVNSIL